MAYSNQRSAGDHFHLLEGFDDDTCCAHKSGHVRFTLLSPALLNRIAQAAERDRRMMSDLRHFMARHSSTRFVYEMSDTEVIRQFRHHLESGRLRVVECTDAGTAGSGGGGGGGGGGSASTATGRDSKSGDAGSSSRRSDGGDTVLPPRPKPVKTWVEVELLDWEGNPAANERYEIRLPDGSLQEGRLDGKGCARFSGIDPGTCQVTFPDFDGREWRES